jgi:hypothetical protein
MNAIAPTNDNILRNMAFSFTLSFQAASGRGEFAAPSSLAACSVERSLAYNVLPRETERLAP